MQAHDLARWGEKALAEAHCESANDDPLRVENINEKLKERDESRKKVHDDIWDAINVLRTTQAVFEKDWNTIRIDMEREMGRIRQEAGVSNAKLDSIITMIADLTKRFDKLEERRRE